MASLDDGPVSPTASPVRKKRKTSNHHGLMNLKVFEDAERSHVRLCEKDQGLGDKELWFFQLPKDVS
jgi:hypothetical protein